MKKIGVITIAAVCLSVAVSMILSTAAAGACLRGDANADGAVTILDATAIQYQLADMTASPFDEAAADIDGNGLDITDATNIQRYLASFDNIYHINEPVAVPDPTIPLPSFDPYEIPLP